MLTRCHYWGSGRPVLTPASWTRPSNDSNVRGVPWVAKTEDQKTFRDPAIFRRVCIHARYSEP